MLLYFNVAPTVDIFVRFSFGWFITRFFFFPPVFCFAQVHTASHVYHGLEAPEHHGVLFPTLLLLVLLLAFTAMLCANNFRLYKWHAYLFSALYACFLVWAFGWSCRSPDVFSSFVSVNGIDDDDSPSVAETTR